MPESDAWGNPSVSPQTTRDAPAAYCVRMRERGSAVLILSCPADKPGCARSYPPGQRIGKTSLRTDQLQSYAREGQRLVGDPSRSFPMRGIKAAGRRASTGPRTACRFGGAWRVGEAAEFLGRHKALLHNRRIDNPGPADGAKFWLSATEQHSPESDWSKCPMSAHILRTDFPKPSNQSEDHEQKFLAFARSCIPRSIRTARRVCDCVRVSASKLCFLAIALAAEFEHFSRVPQKAAPR